MIIMSIVEKFSDYKKDLLKVFNIYIVLYYIYAYIFVDVCKTYIYVYFDFDELYIFIYI